jgi:uncharacterized Ntn-hydrolase superfamily protein
MPAVPSVDEEHIIATFSVVAFDPETQELGIAVQSKFLGAGAVVPWAKAGVGAIATQAAANTSYGPRGLELLERGLTAQETVDVLIRSDPGKDRRQLGIVDAQGRPATFTGEGCNDYAGGIARGNICVQGNILAGEGVVTEMARAFEETKGDLGDTLIAALEAGQEAGGDSRGRQSAGLLIVKEGGGYGVIDRFRDIRVYDHQTPIQELKRNYDLHRRTFGPRR